MGPQVDGCTALRSAAATLAGAGLMALVLQDTPESIGLPPVEGTEEVVTGDAAKRGVGRLVFRNPFIWLLALANFFVYTVRYGILDWGPTFLKQARHTDLTRASWMVAAFEVFGILGMLTGGWLTDHVFGGRGARVCLLYMMLSMGPLLLFWRLPTAPLSVSAALLSVAGFFIYGPQALVGIASANLATKHAAASAVGLTGLFGYLSTVFSGVGVGLLVQWYGWDSAFLMFVFAALVGTILFALCWKARADGYRKVEQYVA